jgi:DNA segregation ATPase FtsK/SpoIIIE, S-DNA-T family
MATQKGKPQFSLSIGFKDARFPKLIGLLFLFLTLYCFVAFTSYLFTWKEDMSKANWAILLRPTEMANALGRLGAVISHTFFYYSFGFSSFMFVYMLYSTGMGYIMGKKMSDLLPLYRQSLITMLWTSYLLAFIFQNSEFHWGGAWGTALVGLTSSFLGSAGIILMLIFIGVGMLVWNNNPDFSKWDWKMIRGQLSFTVLWQSFRDLVAKRPKLGDFIRNNNPLLETENSTVIAEKSITNPVAQNTAKTAENSVKNNQNTIQPNTAEKLVGSDVSEEKERNKPTPVKTNVTREELEQKVRELTNNQVDLDLNKSVKEEQEATGDLDIIDTHEKAEENELEIEINTEEDTTNLQITAENQEHFEPYDPTLDLPQFENPVLDLLEDYDDQKPVIDRAELEANKDQIIETLLNYKIEILKIKATIGPTVTLYEIVPAPGVRISKIKSLEDDIALSLAALGIRIIAPIPGKGTIGIEVPNRNKQVVALKEVLSSPKFRQAKMDLPIALGKTISNEVFVADLAKMPHLLIAGATGQGKSVGINTIIMSLLYKKHPSQLKLILIDPKKVELSIYDKIINHYLGYLPDATEPIVTDTSKVVQTLHSLTIEMDDRYNLLKKASVRNINEYNQKFVQRRLNPEKGHHFMPFIVLVIDEFADLIMTAGKEVELPISRLAQLARAVGIHLIIATQRPSVNIITGVIKANFPARLAFKVASKIDSRTILDSSGAEQLIGRGDMLLSSGSDVIRIQCAFVDTPEVDRVIDYISNQKGYPEPFYLPEYKTEETTDNKDKSAQMLADVDEFFEDAARLIVATQQGSTSMIQRRLKLGYNRAGRIMDQLEHFGIVGPSEGSKARGVSIQDEMELEKHLKMIREKKSKLV